MKKLYFLLPLLILASCIKEPDFDAQVETEDPTTESATDFDFSTTQSTAVQMNFEDLSGNPLKSVVVELLDTESGETVFKAVTNKSGQISEQFTLANRYKTLKLEAHYIGIPNSIYLPVENGSILFDYKGKVDESQVVEAPKQSSSAAPQDLRSAAAGTSSEAGANADPAIVYMGSYDNNGVPDYLEAERDVVSASILEYINASLPEGQPVPQYHPTYLANGKKTTIDVVEESDVWVTFVHEGAGWRNSVGFYTYQTGTPPQSLADIDQVNIAFPNLSFSGSGGGLVSGDKVNIGRFSPGTSIGIVLVSDGWDGSGIGSYSYMVFADKNLNPEPDETLKQHNVLLWDAENELFLLGFEDVRRDNIPFGCDQDFNDAIMFITSNPVTGISTENVSPIDKPNTLDADNDGVNDIFDEYPNDPNKAFDSYYPSATTYGTFAFEDNWPEMGDFDFNDMVVDYRFKHVMNASNQVTEMESEFVVRAVGAGYRNGFGFSLDIAPSAIASVQGQILNSGIIKQNANGTEANQSKAVFIVSDNVHDLFSVSGFVNTESDATYVDPATVTLTIDLTSPKSLAELGSVPYNPFIIISQNRGREAHLPGYAPTDLVDESFFGTGDDGSDPASGIYYRSKTSLPWAIHLPESFAYPFEKQDIRSGHLRFAEWANSYGYSYMDWYRNQTGYRNNNKLYSRGN